MWLWKTRIRWITFHMKNIQIFGFNESNIYLTQKWILWILFETNYLLKTSNNISGGSVQLNQARILDIKCFKLFFNLNEEYKGSGSDL